MGVTVFLKGIAVGFSAAAPVGPIGALCIRRSLTNGRRVGFATGLGAATADAAYGGIAGFGLRSISAFLVSQRFWFGLVGGLFLCLLGVRTFMSRRNEGAAPPQVGSLFTAYFSTLLLTLTNPTTILSFVALFAGLGLGVLPDCRAGGTLVAGVFAGSALWFLLLSGSVGWLRTRANSTWMQTLNRLSGGFIFVSGLYVLATSLR